MLQSPPWKTLLNIPYFYVKLLSNFLYVTVAVNVPADNNLKAEIIKSGMTMSEVVDKLNKKHDRQDTLQNFSGKLRRESFKYTEVEEILDVIRCRIEWNKK
jgi:hypothetical protein